MSKIDVTELAKSLREKIAQLEATEGLEDAGVVIRVGDGVAWVHGLSKAGYSEVLEIETDGGTVEAFALNLMEDEIGAVILGGEEKVKAGASVRRKGAVLDVPVGEELLGRVVDPLGRPLDGGPAIKTKKRGLIERPAIGVMGRKSVHEPLMTGIMSIDAMFPIGRGQRELIIGDRGTGKTAIAVDTILNQKGQNCICVYVAIGQKASTVARVVKTLEDGGAMAYTIVVAATAADSAPLQYLAPYAGVAMAEYFMYKGGHALCVYDDLSKHAAAYRAMSLLLRRPPGREAYPGDVFYLHSRLLERAAKLSDALGAGSITALPIIETLAGDLSAYIPTNVISITDGQIMLDTDAFYSGIRPAINVGLSVSRVGGSAQIKAMKQVAGTMRLDLAQYRELAAFAQFGSDLDKATKAQLDRGARMVETLKQAQYSPLSVAEQVLVIFTAVRGHLADIPVDKVVLFHTDFLKFMRTSHPEIAAAITEMQKLDDPLEADLTKAIEEFKDTISYKES